MLKLLKLIKFMFSHSAFRERPFGVFLRIIKWQLASRAIGGFVEIPYVNQTKIFAKAGMSAASGNWYFGRMDVVEMDLLERYLGQERVFVDVGANIGCYTIFAASLGCKVLAIEPVPTTCEVLRLNVFWNKFVDSVVVFNNGVSNTAGRLNFTSEFDSENRVIDEYNSSGVSTVSIPVLSLDDIVAGQSIDAIKIDVEGFEPFVLQGATQVLDQNSLKIIIIEMNGSAQKYGYSDEDVHNILVQRGFVCSRYCTATGTIKECASFDATKSNQIYTRDLISKALRDD